MKIVYILGAFVFVVSGFLTIFAFKWLIKINEWTSKVVFADNKWIEKFPINRILVGILFVIAGLLCAGVVITKSWTAW